MHSFLLQDYVTIRGTKSFAHVQSEVGWLDFSAFQDVVFWLDIREYTVVAGMTLVLTYQTSASKDESAFVTLATVSKDSTGAPGVTVTLVLKELATNPLATWVRWSLQSTGNAGTWDLTFRIFVSANAVGKNVLSTAVASVPLHAQEVGSEAFLSPEPAPALNTMYSPGVHGPLQAKR